MKDSYWKSSEVWICANHFPPAKHHRLAVRCSYINCDIERPPHKHLHIPELKIVKNLPCAWEKCTRGLHGTHGIQRKNSKYCSLKCKNDNARYRYKLRKAGLAA